jgi:hypothetical protein
MGADQLLMFDDAASGSGEPVAVDQVRRACGRDWTAHIAVNYWAEHDDEYGDWNKTLVVGRSYMVGSHVPMERFLKTHGSRLAPWQKLAYRWALQHPDEKLCLANRRQTRVWEVYRRGQYIEFSLPYHYMGGEHQYVTRDGKIKVHVNAD